MIRVMLALGLATLTAACVAEAPPAASRAAEDSNASAEINALLDSYFQAVERTDLDSFLTLWADSNDVSVVTPTGRLQSPEDLKGFFQGLRDGYTELHLRRSNVTIRTEGSAAWVAFDFELDGVFANGSPAEFTGWETQVYRKTADGWRIAHVHYSVPLVVPAAQSRVSPGVGTGAPARTAFDVLRAARLGPGVPWR